MTFTQTSKFFGALIIGMIFFASTVFSVEAKTVVRSGETVSIAEEQTIEGDFYTAANIINVSGSVKEDMISAGGQITINGSVGDDVLIFAGRADVHGTVGDDLRILAGEVTIAEPIMGDVFVMGGVVNILSTASVSGDVLIYAGQATIEGSIGGDIIGSVDQLRVDAVVSGDIDVAVTQLTLGDRANIEGSVRYSSNNLVVQSLDATVSGDLVRSDPVLPVKDISAKNALIPILSLLFSVLVWYLISRRSLDLVVKRALVKSPRPILLGLAALIFMPIAFSVLLMSMIGTPIGLIGLFGYLLLGLLSIIGLPAVVGQLLMKVFNQPSAGLSLVTLVAGVVGVTLLMLLPIIGQIALLVFMLITLGAMVDLFIRPSID